MDHYLKEIDELLNSNTQFFSRYFKKTYYKEDNIEKKVRELIIKNKYYEKYEFWSDGLYSDEICIGGRLKNETNSKLDFPLWNFDDEINELSNKKNDVNQFKQQQKIIEKMKKEQYQLEESLSLALFSLKQKSSELNKITNKLDELYNSPNPDYKIVSELISQKKIINLEMLSFEQEIELINYKLKVNDRKRSCEDDDTQNKKRKLK